LIPVEEQAASYFLRPVGVSDPSEFIAAKSQPIPLGKNLLGSVYHMFHQTTYLMHTNKKIPCVNGPRWFVQMWLQLYMHQIVAINLNNRHFPSTNYKE
jgi:hypothetical protein